MRRTGYEVGHIPGAVHFNPIRFGRQKRTDVSAHDVAFESLMTRLGISNMRRVVPYQRCAVEWRTNQVTAEQRQHSTATPTLPSVQFQATLRPDWVATASDVVAAINKPAVKIIDAGTAAEIDETNNMGNARRTAFVPSSISIYLDDLLDPTAKTFKSADGRSFCPASHRLSESTELRRGEEMTQFHFKVVLSDTPWP